MVVLKDLFVFFWSEVQLNPHYRGDLWRVSTGGCGSVAVTLASCTYVCVSVHVHMSVQTQYQGISGQRRKLS